MVSAYLFSLFHWWKTFFRTIPGMTSCFSAALDFCVFKLRLMGLGLHKWSLDWNVFRLSTFQKCIKSVQTNFPYLMLPFTVFCIYSHNHSFYDWEPNVPSLSLKEGFFFSGDCTPQELFKRYSLDDTCLGTSFKF